ncbi:hypothetical protein [Niallia circulans]|uniref:hypothetical protein n=1 Tax=Niallia circulans TaxID=1397 RepID=UPI0026EBA7EA|nr:hypothetical protein [Niallia circulans]
MSRKCEGSNSIQEQYQEFGEIKKMNEERKAKEKSFLEDTRDILINYDGCKTEEQLKALIDETRERLSVYLSGTIEDFLN